MPLISLLVLSQGRQDVVPTIDFLLTLPSAPGPADVLSERCHWAEEFPHGGAPPAGVLAAAVLYRCRSRARPQPVA